MRAITGLMLALATALGAAGCICGGPSRAEPAKVLFRVNCGAETAYTDKAGVKWAADQVYSAAAKWGALGGSTVRRAMRPVEGTQAPEVYLTERWGMDGYRFDLPNGKYTLRLHFAETYEDITGPGLRTFTVTIQGKPALPNFDVFKAAGGFAKPVIKEFKGLAVTDGKLLIKFTPEPEAPEINGIEVIAE
jgi:hypothetical protein